APIGRTLENPNVACVDNEQPRTGIAFTEDHFATCILSGHDVRREKREFRIGEAGEQLHSLEQRQLSRGFVGRYHAEHCTQVARSTDGMHVALAGPFDLRPRPSALVGSSCYGWLTERRKRAAG